MEVRKKIIWLSIAVFVWKVSIPSLIHLYNHGLLSGYKRQESALYEIHNLAFVFLSFSVAILLIIMFFEGEFDEDLDQLKNWLNRRNE